MAGQANKSAQELTDFPHVNQHSGPPGVPVEQRGQRKARGVGGGGDRNNDGMEGGPWDILYSEEILVGGREIEEG